MDRKISLTLFALLALLSVAVGWLNLFADAREESKDPASSRPRLSISGSGITLEEPGRETRRFSSIGELLQEIPHLEGEFVIAAQDPGQSKSEKGTKKAVRADPDRKGKKIRIEAGEIPVLEFARFLADYTGLPVVHDSRDKGISDGVISLPAPIDAADDAMVKHILATNRIRVTERQIGKRRAIILESFEGSAGSEEPESKPIVMVRSGDEGSKRVAKGPERRSGTYAGLTLTPVPDVVLAQVDLEEGRGVFVADINEDISKKRSEVAPLKRFDVITHVDDYAVSSHEKFVEAINAVKKGESFSYRFLRKGITKILRAQKAP